MRLCVTWFGRVSASPYEEQIESYRKRVNRRWPSEDCPLRPVPGGREKDPRRALRLEAEALSRHRDPGWRINPKAIVHIWTSRLSGKSISTGQYV